MHHPDIDAWLASRTERERLSELERKAADAWFDMLSPVQRQTFAALLTEGFEGISHLRQRARREEQQNEESDSYGNSAQAE